MDGMMSHVKGKVGEGLCARRQVRKVNNDLKIEFLNYSFNFCT